MSSPTGRTQIKVVRVNGVATNLYGVRTQPTTTLPTFIITSKPVAVNPVIIPPILSAPNVAIRPTTAVVKSELDIEKEVEIVTEHSLPSPNFKRLAPLKSNSVRRSSSPPPSSSAASSTVARLIKSANVLKSAESSSVVDKQPNFLTLKSRNKRLQYCRLCDRGYKSHEAFVKHFEYDHPEIKKEEDMYQDPWRCMYCDSWFDGPRRLSYHVKSFHKDALSVKEAVVDNRPQLVECKLCGAVLKSSLIKHTLKAHASELDARKTDIVKDPRRCPLCFKMCSGEQGIRHHLLRTHGSMTADKDLRLNVSRINNSASPLPVLSRGVKRPSTDSEDVEPKRGEFSGSADDGTFQIVEEDPVISATAVPINETPTDAFDDAGDATYCDICQLDLLNPTHFSRHVELRHKPIPCPLCTPIVWCKGQIGLDKHDDSVHGGAVRAQTADALTSDAII